MSVKNYLSQLQSLLLSKTSKSLSWMFIANMAKALFGFLGFLCILHGISKPDVGILYPLVGIFMTVSQIGDLGLNLALVNLASKTKSLNERNELFATSIKLKFLATVSLVFIGYFSQEKLSLITFKSYEYAPQIFAMFVAAGLSVIAGHFLSVLQVQEKFKQLAIIRITSNGSKFLVLFSLFYMDRLQLNSALAAFIIIPIWVCIHCLFLVDLTHLKKIRSFTNKYKLLLGLSFWVFLSSLANSLLAQTDVLMLSSMISSVEVARFAAAQKLSVFFPLITATIVAVLLPKVSSMQDKQEVMFYLRKSLMVTPLIFLLSLTIPLFCKTPILLLLGEQYQSSIFIFQIIAVQYSLSFIFAPISLVFYQMGRLKQLALMNFAQLIINAVGNFILIPEYHSEGAVFMSVLVRLAGFAYITLSLARLGYFSFLNRKLK